MTKIPVYVFSVLLLFASCGRKQTKQDMDTPIDEEIHDNMNIGVTPTIDCLPLYVAYDRGWFGEEGLTVDMMPFMSHLEIDEALLGRTLDGAFNDLFRTEYLAKHRGMAMCYVTSTELSWRLVANKNTRLTRLEQLGDKMVAMTRFSATDHLTEEALKGVKTNAMVFRAQINDIGVRYGMIDNNLMDTGWLPEPYATQAIQNGHKILKTPKVNDKFGVLTFRAAYAERQENKTKIEALEKVYDKACDSINRKGLMQYAEILQKDCNADTAIVSRLPKIVFTHVEKPDESLLEKVRTY